MSALCVNVHFGGDLGIFQGHEVNDGVFDVHRIVLGLEDKTGRGLIRHVDVGVGCEVLVRQGEITEIDNHREVGAATELIGGIGRIVKTLIEVGAEGGCEIRAGGESEDANAVRIDMPHPERAGRPEALPTTWDKAQNPARDISAGRR